jgi:hypothetical protein
MVSIENFMPFIEKLGVRYFLSLEKKNFGSVLVRFPVVKILYFGDKFIILNLAK